MLALITIFTLTLPMAKTQTSTHKNCMLVQDMALLLLNTAAVQVTILAHKIVLVHSTIEPLTASLKDLNFVAHYGRTAVANHGNASYNDINLGAVYTLPQAWDVGVRYYTNTSLTTQNKAATTINGQQLYKDAWVATLTKTFE